MSIIDASIFKGEISIAHRSQPEVQENIEAFIAKYEPKILNLLMGVEFNALFVAGLIVVSPEVIAVRWSDLESNETLKQIIANYVYFWYMRDQATQTVGMGEAKPKGENATMVSGTDKSVRAWNEMVDMCREFVLDKTVYPEYGSTYIPTWDRFRGYVYPDIFIKINSLNL